MKAQAAIVAEAEVVGVARHDLVLVRKLKGNTFQTVLRARLLDHPEGTSIRLTAGMDRIVFLFSCIFMGAFALLAVAFLLAFLRVFTSFQFSDQDRKDWLFLSTPVLSLAAGVGLIQLGRYVSRHDAPFLTRLFVDATEAKSKGGSAPPPSPKRKTINAEDAADSIVHE